MYNNLKDIFLAFIVVITCASCSKDEKPLPTTIYDKTDHYSDFLFCKYTPVVMNKTLAFDFNEDAHGVRDLKFGFSKKDNKGQEQVITTNEGIRFYKNGVKSNDATFLVSPTEKVVKLGVEFTDKAKFGSHRLFLKVLDNGGLDRIDDNDLSVDTSPLLIEFHLNNNDCWNPLALGLLIFSMIIITLLIIWLIILKPLIYPSFKVGSVVIQDPYYSNRKLNGCCKLIFTSNIKKQSKLSRIFKGKILYEINPVWTSDWVFLPKSPKAIKPLSNRDYSISPFSFSLRQGEYIVTNNKSGDKMALKVN